MCGARNVRCKCNKCTHFCSSIFSSISELALHSVSVAFERFCVIGESTRKTEKWVNDVMRGTNWTVSVKVERSKEQDMGKGKREEKGESKRRREIMKDFCSKHTLLSGTFVELCGWGEGRRRGWEGKTEGGEGKGKGSVMKCNVWNAMGAITPAPLSSDRY